MAKTRLGRRALLGAASVLPLGACGDDDVVVPATAATPFLHGVASGDPRADAVVLWTRVAPPEDGSDVPVAWKIATDAGLTAVVASGEETAAADGHHTVKVDVDGLEPGTTYHYAFEALGARSPVGRTRTAPDGAVASLRIAVVSCSSYAHGYFNGYRRVAERDDLDLVIHRGDYIYEYGDGDYGILRTNDPPHETVTLDDYRRRYAHYRLDPDLQEAHRLHPFVTVWDDHETADNSWSGGAMNHSPGAEGEWTDRRAAAVQAYFEWMPIRADDEGRVQRAFRYGDLVDLIMLDTRLWGREEQASGAGDPALIEPMRQLLGADQEAWLFEQLRNAEARWKIVGQQVMLAQVPQFLNVDQWDGYPAARDRLLAVLRDEGIGDVVVLTGDIHSSWAIDLTDDPFDPAYDPDTGAGSLAVELVTPGITSPGFPASLAEVAEGLIADNPHMKLAELVTNGYLVLDVDHERVRAEWFYIDDIETPNDAERAGAAAEIAAGTNFVEVVG